MLLALTNPIKEAIIKHAAENYAEKILAQEYGSMGFWVALAMVVVYIPLLGRLAAAHFFGKDGTIFGIGLTGLISVALTFAAICMADTSLSGFIPKSIEILVISLCTATVVLLVTSASAQVLSMGFGPSPWTPADLLEYRLPRPAGHALPDGFLEAYLTL